MKNTLNWPAALACFLCLSCTSGTNTNASTNTEEEDAGEVDYQGDTQGGSIPLPPITDDDSSNGADAGEAQVDKTCCNLTVGLPDADGGQPWGRLVFEQSTWNGDGGLPLVYADGVWSTTVCVPVDTFLTYHFEFPAPGIETSPWAAFADAGYIADLADAGVFIDDLIDAGALPADWDGGIPYADKWPTQNQVVTNLEAPTQSNGQGGVSNTVGPFGSCSEADASVGTLP